MVQANNILVKCHHIIEKEEHSNRGKFWPCQPFHFQTEQWFQGQLDVIPRSNDHYRWHPRSHHLQCLVLKFCSTYTNLFWVHQTMAEATKNFLHLPKLQLPRNKVPQCQVSGLYESQMRFQVYKLAYNHRRSSISTLI